MMLQHESEATFRGNNSLSNANIEVTTHQSSNRPKFTEKKEDSIERGVAVLGSIEGSAASQYMSVKKSAYEDIKKKPVVSVSMNQDLKVGFKLGQSQPYKNSSAPSSARSSKKERSMSDSSLHNQS